jgi:CO dehydrogenase/acetyl-CoA synthase epsilon subunit
MMFSQRFQLTVVVTAHAKQRMVERDINDALLLEIIETGTDKDAGNGHHWVFKHVTGRADNLLCVAAVVDNVFVVKTIMHHWELDS